MMDFLDKVEAVLCGVALALGPVALGLWVLIWELNR